MAAGGGEIVHVVRCMCRVCMAMVVTFTTNINPTILVPNMSVIIWSSTLSPYLMKNVDLSFTVRRLFREELSLALRVLTEFFQTTHSLCTLDGIFVQVVRQRDQLVPRGGACQWYCSVFIQGPEDNQVIFKVNDCPQGAQSCNGYQNGSIAPVQSVHHELPILVGCRDAHLGGAHASVSSAVSKTKGWLVRGIHLQNPSILVLVHVLLHQGLKSLD